MSRLRTIRRQIEFARHIPLSQMLHRLRLAWLRGLDASASKRRELSVPKLAPEPPKPLFRPRPSTASNQGKGWRFTFLGRTVEMGPVVAWEAPGRGAADQLWRMNLHYMEYLESLPDEQLSGLVEQWIAANPSSTRGAHSDSWNAYSLSLRVVVWMQQIAARPDLPAVTTNAMLCSLTDQLAYLERHLERDIGGNHLIKNIKALVWASCFFAGPPALRWREKGLRLLRRELDRQILPDGMQYERSPSYHCQVFADLLELRHALGRCPFDGLLDDVLARAAQVIADLAHPDGYVAQFGDAGLTMAYRPAECLAAYEEVIGAPPQPRSAFALGDAGYYGVREGGDYLVVDAGALAPDSLPGHGHGDMLSFEWSLDGQRGIVDQGVFEYIAGPRRMQSRTAAAHNTVWVEGADQAEFFGAFRMGRRGRIELREYRVKPYGGFVLEAQHDGFARTGGGPIHRRRIEASARSLSIHDQLIGEGYSRAQLSFLLAPGVRYEPQGDTAALLHCATRLVKITADQPIIAQEAVWWPDMGREVNVLRLVIAIPATTRHATTYLAVQESTDLTLT